MADLSVDKVFRFVQFVANKESRGWVSPAEFNIAGEVSQLSLYSEGEAQYAVTKQITANMRPFVKVIEESPSSTIRGAGVYDCASDHRLAITVSMDGSHKEINEATIAELSALINSTITPATDDYPIFVEREGTVNSEIHIYPATFGGDIYLEYLSIPVAPLWNYTVPTTRPVYYSLGLGGGVIGDGNSVDFGFDETLFSEISMRVLANVGMNLKEEFVTQYASSFNAQK